MTWRLVVAVAAVVLFNCGPARAVVQPDPSFPVPLHDDSSTTDSIEVRSEKPRSHLSRASISVWGARSIHPGGIIGTIPRGRVGFVGIRYQRLLIPTANENLAAHEAPTLTYTADAIPFATISIPKGTPPGTPSPAIQSVAETGLSTVGVGVYPVGLRVGFRPSDALRPFIDGHTGLFYFFEPVPDERGRQMNFAAGVGGGVDISLNRRTTLTLGYRYHHLSNGFRGSINPGLDANLLYVGIGLVP